MEFCTTYAREKGFASVNFDLIYGLPFQTTSSIEETLQLVYQLRPDRIAFYSYAHLPALKPSQKKLDDLHLPKGLEKYSIYEKAFQSLTDNGYKDLGYDHFALKSDSLYQAFVQNNLHRNFMGFTVQNTSILIGLGVSAISDFSTFYVQNKKTLHDYLESIKNPQFSFETGYELSADDLLIKKHILNLSCYHSTSFVSVPLNEKLKETILAKLTPLIEDNLVSYHNEEVAVTLLGVPFLRNICACFDQFFVFNSNSKHSKSL